MHSLFFRFKSAIAPLISFPFCVSCKAFLSHKQEILCSSCLSKIQALSSVRVPLTEKKYLTVFSISSYHAPLKQLILAKGNSNAAISSALGKLIWHMSPIRSIPFDVITPIPLHWMRHAWRGFNQAEEMAHEIAHASKKPIIHALTRTQKTRFQSELNKAERLSNVHNVFSIQESTTDSITGKHVLLVDDLMTTGATLASAGRALLAKKPSSITAIVVCRVV